MEPGLHHEKRARTTRKLATVGGLEAVQREAALQLETRTIEARPTADV